MYLVHLGGASSCRSLSPSGSGCRGHGGAGSRSRNGLFCVPWARCTRAVAPYLLCEELAVILVDGCGCGGRAHPCEATASGLLSLGSSRPSTGSVGGGAGPGLTRSCYPRYITASDLETGPWALSPRPSPAIRFLPRGWPGWGFVYVSTF